MDTKTGRVYDMEDPKDKSIIEMLSKDPNRIKPMVLMPTAKQMHRRPPRVGRNDPCPCNSGKKFKYCCLLKAQEEE